jgi:iron(II)-dependent oxidoreductase
MSRTVGKRLPHTWEWSYAAQGTDGRVFPWGNSGCSTNNTECLEAAATDGSHCPPLQMHTQGDQEGLQNVTKYPHGPRQSICDHMYPDIDITLRRDSDTREGASPFGVLDMVGNVWYGR